MFPRSSWVDGLLRQETLSVGGERLPPLMLQLLYWGRLDDDDGGGGGGGGGDDGIDDVMIVKMMMRHR